MTHTHTVSPNADTVFVPGDPNGRLDNRGKTPTQFDQMRGWGREPSAGPVDVNLGRLRRAEKASINATLVLCLIALIVPYLPFGATVTGGSSVALRFKARWSYPGASCEAQLLKAVANHLDASTCRGRPAGH